MRTTSDYLAAAKTEWLERLSGVFDRALAHTESPIEQMFLAAAMSYCQWEPAALRDHFRGRRAAEDAGYVGRGPYVFASDSIDAFLIPQFNVNIGGNDYRIDFAYIVPGEVKFAVELDGHDFHERTKEQSRRDKSRDRALTLSGWRVLRFTGSEVFADPEAIVGQIDDELDNIIVAACEREMRKEKAP